MKLSSVTPLFSLLALMAIAGCATLDRTDRNVLENHHVSTTLYARMIRKDPLSLTDIIELSRKQVAPGFIIHYLSSTYMVYRLHLDEISRLREAKVAREVIDYLIDSGALYGSYPSGYYYRPYPYPDYGCADYRYYYGGSAAIVVGHGHRRW